MAFLVAGPLAAQPSNPPSADPQQPPKPPAETSIEELERRVQELESQAAKPATRPPQETSTVSETGPLSGYMDLPDGRVGQRRLFAHVHLSRPEREDPQLDFH